MSLPPRARLGSLLPSAPGPLPLLAAAFSLGLACPLGWEQIEPWGIFPLVAASFAAARHGLGRLALACLLGAFFLAGSLRAPVGPDASNSGGSHPIPGPPSGPCASVLAGAGLPFPTDASPAALEIEGWVSGIPALGPEVNRVRIDLTRARPARERPVDPAPEWIEARRIRVQLTMARGLRPLPGDRIRARVILDEVETGLPGGLEARRRLDRAGIACRGKVVAGALGVLEEGGGILARVETLRRRISAGIEARVRGRPEAALLAALSVGDRSLIGPEQNERFAASGLAHVLSVSGLHVGLTILGLYRIARWLLARTSIADAADPQRLAALLVLPAVPAYALLTGADPPVLRAAIGTGLYLLAMIAMRAPEAWSALAAAALAILTWDPAALHEVSFQLSFAACLGLLAVAPGLRALLPFPRPGPDASRWRRWLEVPLLALTTTAAATLATLPLTAHYFQRASVASLPANVVAVPVGLAVTAVAALAAAVGVVWTMAMAPFLWLASPLARLLDDLAAWFAEWPGSRIAMTPPSAREMAAMWAITVGLATLRRSPKRSLLALLAAVLALYVPSWLPSAKDDRLKIDFLAVGQGDATLLRLPDGRRLLVDAGGDLRGERDVAQRVLLPQLAELGAASLDAVILSHLHPDHVGSVPALLRLLPVAEVWSSGRPLEGRFGAPIAEAMQERGIPRRILARGSPPIELGDVRIEILGPPDREGLRDDPLLSANDGSLVLQIIHGEVTILLPGDVEAEGEAALVDSGADLRATLLKAPHHGSSTSSTAAFLERVRPHHVVFCVGRRNQFGFPKSEVIERYEKRGCRLHRTDRGPVRFVSDGTELTLAQ